MEEFGDMDGQVLDLAFLTRNPPRYGFDKYLKLFQRSQDREFVIPLLILKDGYLIHHLYQEFYTDKIINDCYKNNSLISSNIESASGKREGGKQEVDLGKVSMPVQTVFAEKDDFVSPASFITINDRIASKDKPILKNPGGHVALCISNNAYKKLWPEVAKLLLSR
jgi:poly[(R)-3-hydroxyalkanoate] polymerase subunit PhaC